MTDQKQQGVGRREFVLMTSGTVLAAMAMGQVQFPSPTSGRSVSLGYADPDAAAGAAARFVPTVMSAERVPSGDGEPMRGARGSARGFKGTPKPLTGRDDMPLLTSFAP